MGGHLGSHLMIPWARKQDLNRFSHFSTAYTLDQQTHRHTMVTSLYFMLHIAMHPNNDDDFIGMAANRLD